MPGARTRLRQVLSVYATICVLVFAATRFESVAVIGRYVHLMVAAIFLLASIRLTRDDPGHFGVALGGLLDPPPEDGQDGPLGLFDLGRALRDALPVALKELGVALAVAAVVFPIYGLGFYGWNQPTSDFALSLPRDPGSYVLAQLVVVALPEEAFFRGYLQTALEDFEKKRVSVLGVSLAPGAWLGQALLFAAIHFMVEPHPARLAVFFPALLFGWTRVWRGGIGAALALHAMSNLYSEILARSWL